MKEYNSFRFGGLSTLAILSLAVVVSSCGNSSNNRGDNADGNMASAGTDTLRGADSVALVEEPDGAAGGDEAAEGGLRPVVILENMLNGDNPEWIDTLAVVHGEVFALSSWEDIDASYLSFGGEVVFDNPVRSVDSIAPKVFSVATITDTLTVNLTKKGDVEALKRLNLPIEGYSRQERAFRWGNDSYLFRVDMPSAHVDKSEAITRWLIGLVQQNVSIDSKLPRVTAMKIPVRPADFSRWKYTGNIWNRDSVANFFANRYFSSLLAENEEQQPEWVCSSVCDIRAVVSNDSLVTVQKFDYDYTGGAHGMNVERLLTYDIAKGRELTNDDLFDADHIDEVKKALLEAIAADPNYNEWSPVEDWNDVLRKLTSDSYNGDNVTASLADFKLPQAALSRSGVVFSYQPYDIQPYAAGAFHFTVPYSSIIDSFTPEGKALVETVMTR